MKTNDKLYYNKCDSCDNYVEANTSITMSFSSHNKEFSKDDGVFKICPKCYKQIKRFIAEREPECVDLHEGIG